MKKQKMKDYSKSKDVLREVFRVPNDEFGKRTIDFIKANLNTKRYRIVVRGRKPDRSKTDKKWYYGSIPCEFAKEWVVYIYDKSVQASINYGEEQNRTIVHLEREVQTWKDSAYTHSKNYEDLLAENSRVTRKLDENGDTMNKLSAEVSRLQEVVLNNESVMRREEVYPNMKKSLPKPHKDVKIEPIRFIDGCIVEVRVYGQ